MSPAFALSHKRIWIAGHTGLVGSALVRRLKSENCHILTAPRAALDLRRQADVEAWVSTNKPDAVILAAATVGGIGANASQPADFLYDNMMIEANVIHAAAQSGVQKLLFLGSSCIYPRDAVQPISESTLLTGSLEPTNEAYALAKIAGIKLCQSLRVQYGHDFITAMPCNLYGSGDRYDAQRSHVIPALILKMEQARLAGATHIELWGTGTPLREFLYVDDLADALILLLQTYSGAVPVNIGSGHEVNIKDLAHMIATASGYRGEIRFNPAHPDGTPRKILDSSRINALGWTAQTPLVDGLKLAVADFRQRYPDVRAA